MTQRRIVTALVLSIGASVGLMITYLTDGGPRLEGALLGFALAGIGWSLVVAAHDFLDERVSEEYPSFAGSDAEVGETVGQITRPISKRKFIFGLLAAAFGALAVALGFPIRSLGRGDEEELFGTGWSKGQRVVDASGQPVRVDTLEYGSAITAFPEEHVLRADSVVMLLRIDPRRLTATRGRSDWTPEGYVAYSKICTHAGCPVGLFDDQTGNLTCPCHQSSFDALAGAEPLFGPAARPLPQLPLAIDGEGFLVADGEFSHPVGPGFSGLPGGGA